MPARPLLVLPAATPTSRPKSGGGAPKIFSPTFVSQTQRFSPTFRRLQDVLKSGSDLELRNDPSSIAPERALVFEVAGSITDIQEAVKKIRGLEFLIEEECVIDPDERFAYVDGRKDTIGQRREDQQIAGRLYVAMPDTAALQQLVSLWDKWEKKIQLPFGLAPWKNLFVLLRDIRPWGIADRIPDETIEYWRDKIAETTTGMIRTEIELWFSLNEAKQRRASNDVISLARSCGGQLIDHSVIPEIGYEGMLLDLPATEIARLVNREAVHLAVSDPIMYLRPQSSCTFPTHVEPVSPGDPVGAVDFVSAAPIAALLDGVPIQRHRLLEGRLIVDDPDDLSSRSTVDSRVHGTQMASLVIHGDRNVAEEPIRRPLYVRPVMYASSGQDNEHPHPDKLLIDVIFRAIKRIKEGDSEGEATAPSVFIVNMSLGDSRRPFCGPMSPWGRALDYLSETYSILFLVSAGNILSPLRISKFTSWTEFEDATPEDRESSVLLAMFENKAFRTLLSPAEALNVITVGAWHEDAIADRTRTRNIFPFTGATLPNLSSAQGLGHRKVVKPEIHLPGGREPVRFTRAGGGELTIAPVTVTGSQFGLRTAGPGERGSLSTEALTAGTSAATALATRAAHKIFDALMDRSNGSMHADMPSRFYAVVVKALLVHRAKWSDTSAHIEELYGPVGKGKDSVRRDNVSRVLGFGRPTIEESLECSENRATLVGYGELYAEGANLYRIPLPPCLAGTKEPRAITITLSWFSPINPRHQAYRAAQLEAGSIAKFNESVGVERSSNQPSHHAARRGSVFHVRYSGERAVAFIDDGHLLLRVWCLEKTGNVDQPVKYGIAVTVEAGLGLPIYEEVRSRLAVPVPVTT